MSNLIKAVAFIRSIDWTIIRVDVFDKGKQVNLYLFVLDNIYICLILIIRNYMKMILNWLFKKYNLINQDRMKEINYKQVKVFGAINKMINKYFILVFCLLK
jgi:hypothetical protein